MDLLVRVEEREEPWLAPDRRRLAKVARRYVSKPQAFARRFRTDVEFLRAVYAATPQARDAASGEERGEIRVLLGFKVGSRRPIRRLAAPGLEAIIYYPPKEKYSAGPVFDRSGVMRAYVKLEVSKDGAELDPGTLLIDLLADARFRALGHEAKPETQR